MLSSPNHPLRLRHTGGGSQKQSRVKRAQIESAVESIGERGQVSRSIFAEVERMVTAAQTGLEVTEYGVDPLELGQVLRLALRFQRGPDARMTMASLGWTAAVGRVEPRQGSGWLP